MRELAVLLLFLSPLVPANFAQSSVKYRLADVRSVYVDARSFNFAYSSCSRQFGGMTLPCPNHSVQREEFLIALKRWIGKSGFTIAEEKDDADGILQGTLSIDDRAKPYRDKDSPSIIKHDGPQWTIAAWMLNADGDRIWNLGYGYPGISHKWSEKPKIEAKKLAAAFEHDFKKKK